MITNKRLVDRSREQLVDDLLNDRSHHIEFNGHLTNHNKHAVVALYKLNAASERIKKYYDAYALETPYGYGLEPPKVSRHEITVENWKQYLGQRTSYSSYCEFFEAQEKQHGLQETLSRFVPTLLPGWVGAFTHGTIHLGWALDIRHRWMTIEGLAYMAFAFVSCHPERLQPDPVPQADSLASRLLSFAEEWNEGPLAEQVESICDGTSADTFYNIHPELVRSGLQLRIARMLGVGHPKIHFVPTFIRDADIAQVWNELQYVSALLYMALPGNFVLLHLFTSFYALEKIAEHLPQKQQRVVIEYAWTGMLGILFAGVGLPERETLEELHRQYSDSTDRGKRGFGEFSWEETVARAVQEEEEHNPKMAYVLRQVWERTGQKSIFRIAAARFTTTPELPKSFELPPTE